MAYLINLDGINAKVIERDIINANVSNVIQRVNPELESLTINPSIEEKEYNPEKYGFDKVTVKAIETEGIIVEPSIEAQVIEPTEGKFINKVTVEEITAAIDSDIIAENIKTGINILGVEGTLEPVKVQTKQVTPTTEAQSITPDTGYNGISLVEVEPVTSNIDSNIIPENIRKDVSILGINGTYVGTDTSDATATANDIINPKTAYVNGEKIVGEIIPQYKITSTTLNVPYNISNNTGYKIIDISLQFGFCLLASNIPASEYIIGKIVDNAINVTSNKITKSNLGLPSGAVFADASISKIINDDETLTIGICVENSGNHVYAVKMNLENFSVVSYIKSASSFFGLDSTLNNKFMIEINPKDPNVFILMGYKTLRLEIWLGIVQGNSVTTTQLQRYSASGNSVGYIVWKKDGTAFSCLTENGSISLYFTFNLNTKSATFIKAFNKAITFFKDDYILECNGYLYKTSNVNSVYKTLTEITTPDTNNPNLIYSIEDYVVIHAMNNHYKIYYINPDTFEVTLKYSYSYSMTNNNNYKRTISWGSLENNALSIAPMSSLTNVVVTSVDMIEALSSLILNGDILVNTNDSNATSYEILANKTAYVQGDKVTGTMPNNGVLNYNPSTSSQTIPTGYTSGGTISAVTSSIDSNIVEGNIKAGVSILGVTGTYEGSGGGNVEGIKQFTTEEEMQTDNTGKDGDLAVVYSDSMGNMTSTTETQVINFPSIVVLPETFTGDVYGMFRAVDDNMWFDMQVMLSPNSCEIMAYGESGDWNIRYTSTDGKTYTRTDGGAETIDFGTAIKCYEWNEAFGYFMQVGSKYFGGLFKFDGTSWLTVPNQLNTKPEDVFEKEFYSSNGIEVGTLQKNTDLTLEELITRINVWDRFNQMSLMENLSFDYAFAESKITSFPYMDTSKVTYFGNAFTRCSNLKCFPDIDITGATNIYYMFDSCTSLVTAPKLDMRNTTHMPCMFRGCSALVNVPVYQIPNVKNANNVFYNCNALSNESLNNILLMCVSGVNVENKTLKGIGLTSAQANICKTLSNYSAFINAGWATGY